MLLSNPATSGMGAAEPPFRDGAPRVEKPGRCLVPPAAPREVCHPSHQPHEWNNADGAEPGALLGSRPLPRHRSHPSSVLPVGEKCLVVVGGEPGQRAPGSAPRSTPLFNCHGPHSIIGLATATTGSSHARLASTPRTITASLFIVVTSFIIRLDPMALSRAHPVPNGASQNGGCHSAVLTPRGGVGSLLPARVLREFRPTDPAPRQPRGARRTTRLAGAAGADYSRVSSTGSPRQYRPTSS
jgi:hypothetical protein